MKITHTIVIHCLITGALAFISGCTTSTHPQPDINTQQAVINPVDIAAQSVDLLMEKISLRLDDQISSNQIGVERSAADSLRLTFGASSFNSGKSGLSKDMKTNLDALTTVLVSNPQNIIHVIGHTDSSGKKSWNQKLSEKRALSVTDYLISKGQDADRIVSQGLGESSPVADNATKQGRALNRRIEIYLRQIIKGNESLALTPPI